MTHWSDAWLGRPWRAGEFECVDLVAEAVEELGLGVRIPLEWLDEARTAGPSRRAALLAAACHGWDGARPLGAGEAAREGDVAVIRRRGGQARPGHVGLLVAPAGGAAGHVLHVLDDARVVRQDAGALAAAGLEVCGVWRWT